jgi:RING-box protein 1
MSELKFVVEQWSPVAIYNYKIDQDTCSICRNNIMEQCVQCSTTINKKCEVSLGKCGHGYHYHCISKWLQTNQSCPIDMAPFEYDIRKLDTCKQWKKQVKKIKQEKLFN